MQLDHPPTPGPRQVDWARPEAIMVHIGAGQPARITREECDAQLDLIAAHSLRSVVLRGYWFDESDLACFVRQMQHAAKIDGLRTGTLS